MKNSSTWQGTLTLLKSGNANFISDALKSDLQDSPHRKEMVNDQKPFAVILTCSDSRVVPALIFDTGIGELFVVSVAGNVANTSTIASIEYAVANLNVKLIIVLGHQNCGAITAALGHKDNGKNLNHLLRFIQPAISKSESKEVNEISHIHAKLTAEKLIKESSIITNAINTGNIKIIPAYYNLETGQVKFFE